ncbi:type I-E CRISPR-associated protein Cse2/CasB [Glycomyces sp. A-F 0318]|uniref:type I-E CRISPR-associated protein Cse2/CasB n=1 Tax=Glycomyces amatae TaxID=2881355 RepID=UPI001E512094|nr:type I-E CRISPR-associated protein Cse2/CasB [Glycomyces amatae]MCD0447511.1 type I-E CRISPR-associated protein Cse2/CasB [Glycomyces amatae]
MPTPPPPGETSSRDANQAFTANVERLCRHDKRARADLRRGLGRRYEQSHGMHRHLVPFMSEHASSSTRHARYTVAALIADTPADAPAPSEGDATPTNLGASLGQAVRHGAMKPNSAEATLHLFTRQHSATIARSLPALARQIRRSGAAIDWGRLVDDLTWWDRDRDRIATRWLDHYYRAVQPHDDPQPDTPDTDTGSDQ